MIDFECKTTAITQPIIEGVNSADEFIAYAARVSNPDNQMNNLTAPKLIKYLINHRHWSPFEMVSVTMEINTTRDIGRQILRHRSFSFQEFSQRYADPTKDLGFVLREARLQDKKNRQNSIDVQDENLALKWEAHQYDVIARCEQAYKWALSNGIAKEQARVVLPEGLTRSRMYMAGTLRSWITYVSIREENGTQKEHVEIALKVKNELLKHFPTLEDALGNVSDKWNT